MKIIIIAIIYVVLFHVSAKMVFEILGGFKMSRGLFGVDWTGVFYVFIISFLASIATILGTFIVDKKLCIRSVVLVTVIAIIIANLYQFLQSPDWFLNTLALSTIHIITTNLVFGAVLIVTNWCLLKVR